MEPGQLMTPRNNDPVNNVVQNPVDYVHNFPIGYRFVPEDDELINDYLKLRIANEPIPVPFMYDVNLYKYTPDKLTVMFDSYKKDEWLFFTPRDRKYPNGSRPNRAAGNGYWKATGADKLIKGTEPKETIIGFRKTLVFYEGKPPKGGKTDWIMHEYRVKEEKPRKKERNGNHDMKLDDWVLCRIYLKPPKVDKKSSGTTTPEVPVLEARYDDNGGPIDSISDHDLKLAVANMYWDNDDLMSLDFLNDGQFNCPSSNGDQATIGDDDFLINGGPPEFSSD